MTSTSGLTFQEITQSLTGFDEIAITKHMNVDPYAKAEDRPVWMMRAYVFAHLRREAGGGLTDPDAKERVMNMPLSEVNNYFETSTEVDEQDPDTDAGKDSSSSTETPTT